MTIVWCVVVGLLFIVNELRRTQRGWEVDANAQMQRTSSANEAACITMCFAVIRPSYTQWIMLFVAGVFVFLGEYYMAQSIVSRKHRHAK